MLWIRKYRNIWRVLILVVVLAAITGPWTIDVIMVPSEFLCSAPHVRLDGDFCGKSLPGTWIFRTMVDGFVYASVRPVTGDMVFIEYASIFFFNLLVFPLVLPFFSTLFLILRGERRRRQVFNIVAWSLAAGMGLLIGISDYPKLFWMAWGVWLYVGLAASALILEALTLAAGTRLSPG